MEEKNKPDNSKVQKEIISITNELMAIEYPVVEKSVESQLDKNTNDKDMPKFKEKIDRLKEIAKENPSCVPQIYVIFGAVKSFANKGIVKTKNNYLNILEIAKSALYNCGKYNYNDVDVQLQKKIYTIIDECRKGTEKNLIQLLQIAVQKPYLCDQMIAILDSLIDETKEQEQGKDQNKLLSVRNAIKQKQEADFAKKQEDAKTAVNTTNINNVENQNLNNNQEIQSKDQNLNNKIKTPLPLIIRRPMKKIIVKKQKKTETMSERWSGMFTQGKININNFNKPPSPPKSKPPSPPKNEKLPILVNDNQNKQQKPKDAKNTQFVPPSQFPDINGNNKITLKGLGINLENNKQDSDLKKKQEDEAKLRQSKIVFQTNQEGSPKEGSQVGKKREPNLYDISPKKLMTLKKKKNFSKGVKLKPLEKRHEDSSYGLNIDQGIKQTSPVKQRNNVNVVGSVFDYSSPFKQSEPLNNEQEQGRTIAASFLEKKNVKQIQPQVNSLLRLSKVICEPQPQVDSLLQSSINKNNQGQEQLIKDYRKRFLKEKKTEDVQQIQPQVDSLLQSSKIDKNGQGQIIKGCGRTFHKKKNEKDDQQIQQKVNPLLQSSSINKNNQGQQVNPLLQSPSINKNNQQQQQKVDLLQSSSINKNNQQQQQKVDLLQSSSIKENNQGQFTHKHRRVIIDANNKEGDPQIQQQK